MFIISFAIFVFVLTVFENVFLALLLLILLLLWHSIVKKFRNTARTSLLITLAFLISILSIFVKNYKYDQDIKSLPNVEWRISRDMDWPVWKYFVGTGIVSDIYSYQKYVFQDNAGREYFLISSRKFEIWDILWLNWRVDLAYTGAGNIFDFQKQWNDFVSKPNLSWLFDYEFNYSKWLMMKGFYGTIYGQSYLVFKDECEYHNFADDVFETEDFLPPSSFAPNFPQGKNVSLVAQIYPPFLAPLHSLSGTKGLKKSLYPPVAPQYCGAVRGEQLPLIKGDNFSGKGNDENLHSLSEQNCKSKISFIQKIRKGLQKMVVSAYGENKQAGLILWMLVWDRSQIPPDDYQWFVKSWLVHIIAVSWWNIIMIVVFLWAILFFLPFYVRNAVILLTIILYSMICWLDSSVFRATVMWWLGMLALFWWKEINIWRAMSTAFIVMLIINPYFLAYDVGFLLSFSAIIGIIYFWKLIENCASYFKKQWADNENQTTITSKKKKNLFKTWFQKFLKEFVTPTVGATIGVLPVMLFFMGTTNLTWIIANFLVVPIVAVVMIYGFISTVLFQVLPWEIRLWPENLLLNYIYFMSELAQRFGVYLHAEGSWIKYVLLGLFIVWLVLVRMRR